MTRFGMLAVAGIAGAMFAFAACDGDSNTSGTNNNTVGTSSGGSGGSTEIGSSGPGAADGCPECIEEGTGVGTDNPFDVDNNPSDGVGTNPDGALVLDIANSNIPGIIWIANTSLGTVSKVDTTTYAVLGRYAIGSNDPSRTSVNGIGDVFVGNRAGNTLTKVSAGGADCPDTNGDGTITTSTGFGDVLAWGQDDCVLWDVPVPNTPTVRGVAAQDLVVPDPLPDWPDHTKVEHYVWVGGTGQQTVYKFDGDDGNLLVQTTAPSAVYGLALDGSGQLWISGATDGSTLGRVDTTQCVDQASCDAAVICTSNCSTGACVCDPGCPTACDDAVKERIVMPYAVYGITVDFKQRVWLGGGSITRYDPSLPMATRVSSVTGLPYIHGIAADAEGFVWGAGTSSGIVRVEGDTMANTTVSVPNAKGMAVDKDGKIWAIAWGTEAHVVTPGPTLMDYVTTPSAVTGLGSCYTYSDMTGLQLALATQDPGYYRQTFTGCEDGLTAWKDLKWDVETPPGTRVRFNVRTANTVADLGAAQWIPVAKIEPDMSPASIQAKLDNAGIAPGTYLEVEVVLETTPIPGELPPTPVVYSFSVSHPPCGGTIN